MCTLTLFSIMTTEKASRAFRRFCSKPVRDLSLLGEQQLDTILPEALRQGYYPASSELSFPVNKEPSTRINLKETNHFSSRARRRLNAFMLSHIITLDIPLSQADSDTHIRLCEKWQSARMQHRLWNEEEYIIGTPKEETAEYFSDMQGIEASARVVDARRRDNPQELTAGLVYLSVPSAKIAYASRFYYDPDEKQTSLGINITRLLVTVLTAQGYDYLYLGPYSKEPGDPYHYKSRISRHIEYKAKRTWRPLKEYLELGEGSPSPRPRAKIKPAHPN